MTREVSPASNPDNFLRKLVGADDRFNLLVLACFYGAYFFLGTTQMYAGGGITEHDEFSIFVQGWTAVPLLTILSMLGIRKINKDHFQEYPVFFPILLGVNALFGLLTVAGFYLAWNFDLSVQTVTLAVLGIFPMLQIITFLALTRKGNSVTLAAGRDKIENISRWLLLLGAVAIGLLFGGVARPDADLRSIFIAIPFGFLVYLHKFTTWPSATKNTILWDVFAILLILLACFDPQFAINNGHENFYLGPVNALLHGKTMLVDVYSQYGVFLHEFLALIFKSHILPLNYQGLAFLVALLCMLQYALVYFISKALLKTPAYSFILLSIVLLLNFFATAGYFQAYPSIGALRFGLPYLLVAMSVLRLKYPTRSTWFLWLEYGILGISSIWSFETFIYTGTVFYGLRGYEALSSTNTFSGFLKRIAFELLASVLVIALFHSVQALAIYLRAGAWPNWAYYFGFIYLYSLAGFGQLPITAQGSWFLVIAIYFASLMYPFAHWIIHREWDRSLETKIILGFTFMGIAQFTYYLGRSHPNNLFHICVPAILIAAYGAGQIKLTKTDNYKNAGFASLFLVYTALAFLGITYVPNLIEKIPNTGFGLISTILGQAATSSTPVGTTFQDIQDRLWRPEPTSLETAEAVKLIETYLPDETRVMLLVPNAHFASATEALFLSGKAHILPITDQIQDSISSQISDFIVNYPTDLKKGDVIVLPTEPEMLLYMPLRAADDKYFYAYQYWIVLRLCGSFDLKEIENTSTGLTAFRLKAQGNGTSAYCAQVGALKNR